MKKAKVRRHRLKFTKFRLIVILFIIAFCAFLYFRPPAGQLLPQNLFERLTRELHALEERLAVFYQATREKHPPQAGYAWDTDEPIRVFFAPCQPDSEGGIQPELCKLIRSATSSIRCAVYDLEDLEVAEALIESYKRGVRVAIVADSDCAKREAVQNCRDAGIPIVFDNRQAFMHNKFLVVDDDIVWTGSTNLTTNCFYKNNNNSLAVKSDFLARNYTNEFQEMFVDKKFGPRSPSNNPYPTVTVGEATISVYFAPEDKIGAKLKEEINKARLSIDVMAFVFTSVELAKALSDFHKRGADARVLLEKRNAASSASQDEALVMQGIRVYYDANRDIMHNKVMILDGETVITGSYNFTAAADTTNDENLLIVKSKRISELYKAEFLKLLEDAEPLTLAE